jgi:hypothetical protein
VEVSLHAFLTLVLNGVQWSASCPSPLQRSYNPVDRRLGVNTAGPNTLKKEEEEEKNKEEKKEYEEDEEEEKNKDKRHLLLLRI